MRYFNRRIFGILLAAAMLAAAIVGGTMAFASGQSTPSPKWCGQEFCYGGGQVDPSQVNPPTTSTPSTVPAVSRSAPQIIDAMAKPNSSVQANEVASNSTHPKPKADKFIYGIDRVASNGTRTNIVTKTVAGTMGLHPASSDPAPQAFGTASSIGHASYCYWVEYWQQVIQWTRAWRFNLCWTFQWVLPWHGVALVAKSGYFDHMNTFWHDAHDDDWSGWPYPLDGPAWPLSGYRIGVRDDVNEIFPPNPVPVRTMMQEMAVHLHDNGRGIVYFGSDGLG